MHENFYAKLQQATDEVSQVQPLYRTAILYALNHSDSHEYPETDKNGNPLKLPLLRSNALALVGNTDGLIRGEYLDTRLDYADATYIEFFILLECKLDQSFRDIKFTAGVLLQVICYLKQMQDKGNVLPKAIVIGSKVDCFAIGINCLAPYVAKNIEGYKTASTAYKYNTEIIQEIINDVDIQSQLFIYDITPEFNIKDELIAKVVQLIQGTNLKLSLDPRSVAKAFDYFSMYVLKDSSKIEPRLQSKYFLQLVLNADDNDFLPEKGKAYIDGKKVDIDGKAFRAFQSIYKVTEPYTSDEERQLTAIADRLIEDADRRRKGDFYTPTVWVEEAHKLLSKHLGDNWRDEYVVWDCACGTKNLTRDYNFKELYCSTLIEGDLELSKKYNVTGTPKNELGCSFQYDFLNDDIDEFELLAEVKRQKGSVPLDVIKAVRLKLYKVAPGLVESLYAGKKLLFLINPPYAANGEISCTIGQNKTGVGESAINRLMGARKMGKGARQLYAQFIYRICLLKDLFDAQMCIGMFTPTLLFTGEYCNKLRELMSDCSLAFTDGFMLRASEFANVAANWGISFAFCNSSEDKGKYNYAIATFDKGKITATDFKVIYNLSKESRCSDWVRDKTEHELTKDRCYLSNALGTYHKEGYKGTVADDTFLGGFFTNANCVEKNNQFVALTSVMMGDTNAINLTTLNFKRCITYFAARRLITGPYATWINWQDEYMIPDTMHKDYPRFEADSIVYSLFNPKSNQSSLRQIDYNGKKWDIKNEFFWLSTNQMLTLARTGKMNKAVEQDILNYGTSERYVYTLLQDPNIRANMSATALAVLEKATELLVKSFEYRKDFDFNHPEYHINTWDAGWYQIKGILKEYMPDDLKEFNELYKTFSDELRPLVYELGFLYK